MNDEHKTKGQLISELEEMRQQLVETNRLNNELEAMDTQRKQAEKALRESTEKIHAMFDSMTDGITFGDLEGNIMDANEAAVRMHEYESKECVGDLASGRHVGFS